MIRFALVRGGVYRARVVLNWAESFAGNALVAAKFRTVGFSDITVKGSGSQRIIEGSWMHDDVEGDMPSQVDEVIEVSRPDVVVPPLPRKKIENECTCIEGGSKPGPVHMDGCAWWREEYEKVKQTWVWYDPRTWFYWLYREKEDA